MATYLGQNFLVDAKVKAYITQKIYNIAKQCDALVEIGPGKGALTTKICQFSPFFLAIEKDETMVSVLKKKIPDLEVIQEIQKYKKTQCSSQQQNEGATSMYGKKNVLLGDVLEIDLATILQHHNIPLEKTFIVGNIPYYITSPILRKFFGTEKAVFGGGYFMVQKEVGEKLATTATKKSYLRWLINYAHTVTYEKTICTKAFKPQPQVVSCIINITPKKQNERPLVCFDALLSFLEHYSQFKRKTLGAAMKILEKKAKKISGEEEKRKKTFFSIPSFLQTKRLEELTRENVREILLTNKKALE